MRSPKIKRPLSGSAGLYGPRYVNLPERRAPTTSSMALVPEEGSVAEFLRVETIFLQLLNTPYRQLHVSGVERLTCGLALLVL